MSRPIRNRILSFLPIRTARDIATDADAKTMALQCKLPLTLDNSPYRQLGSGTVAKPVYIDGKIGLKVH